MKLYTKRGDTGETELFGGGRIDKDAARIDAIGAVDEANNALGWARVAVDDASLDAQLRAVQHRLFELGADLATPREPDEGQPSHIPRIEAAHARELEAWIDDADARVEPMRHFILPGGTEAAARLHIARGVARLAERRVVALSRIEPVTPAALVLLNRLSDYLFAAARLANHHASIADTPWLAPDSRA